jgi:CRISPR-associated protein Csd1
MLNELIAYADQHLADSEPGFRTREVRWSIEIASDGRFMGILPLGDGKRGAELPRCPEMHAMNGGGKSHFLVESAQTVALLFKSNEDEKKIDTAREKHHFYTQLIREAAKSERQLALLADVLEDDKRLGAIRLALVTHKAKPTDWVTWRIDGTDPRLDSDVQAWWRAWRRADQSNDAVKKHGKDAAATAVADPQMTIFQPFVSTENSAHVAAAVPDTETMLCLLTGLPTKPLPTHPKITGLSSVGGSSMGDVLVGFDKAAFCSYGLDQSANAAMSAEAVQKYVDALNDLIRNHSRRLANTLVAHWYGHRLPPEDDPLAYLMGIETDEQSEAVALAAARRLLDAIRTGERPDLSGNRYYAMTLSGASGRVMVRDWMEGSFENLVCHITEWFSDLQIIDRDGTGHARDPKFMAVCGALVRDLKDLPAPTAATLWKVAILGLPIPQPLMAQALVRFRADLVNRDQPPFNHARMGLIKAYFVRRTPGGDPSMTTTYNPNHPSAAYHCGALLALFASLQRAALGDIGAGVVQRFYAASSQTPGLVLGRLAANARNHLAKLEPKLAWWYEERIAEVMSGLGDAAPRILDLEGQGLFALGYYQKLAQLRAGNKTTTNNQPNNQQDV